MSHPRSICDTLAHLMVTPVPNEGLKTDPGHLSPDCIIIAFRNTFQKVRFIPALAGAIMEKPNFSYSLQASPSAHNVTKPVSGTFFTSHFSISAMMHLASPFLRCAGRTQIYGGIESQCFRSRVSLKELALRNILKGAERSEKAHICDLVEAACVAANAAHANRLRSIDITFSVLI